MSSNAEAAALHWRASLSVRLIVTVAVLFIVGNAAVLTAAYLTLGSSLRQRDRSEILAELQDLRGAYEEGGLAELRKDAEQAGSPGLPFFIRLYALDGRKAFERLPPAFGAFDLSRLSTTANVTVWTTIPAGEDEETAEVLSQRLKNGALIQVGQSSAQREDVLERFRWIGIAVFIPTVFLSLLLGFVFVNSALRPIRHLLEVVESVLAGQSGSRVPVGRSKDDLERLSVLFNRMLERIEGLIAAMKGSLDAVAHDLRTPITRLRAGAEAALRSEADLTACRESLADCVEEADRVSATLTTLMDISEAESGAMSLKLEVVALDALAVEVAELYRYVAEEKGLRLEIGPPCGAKALCDRNRMRQVLANLVDNAVKYTPPGGRVEIAASIRHPDATISVRDSGPGIPSEELPRVFERLYRGRMAREQRGLGLGLSLVQAVVNSHGGRVRASSPATGGSLFEVSLEACDEPAIVTQL